MEEVRIINHLAPNLPQRRTQGSASLMLGDSLMLRTALTTLRKLRTMKTLKFQPGLLMPGVSRAVKTRKMILIRLKPTALMTSHPRNLRMKKNLAGCNSHKTRQRPHK